MKRYFAAAFIGMAFSAPGQDVQVALASYTSSDKLAIAKSSIEVPAWHERAFWPVYEEYVKHAEEAESKHHRSLSDLTSIDGRTSDNEARQAAENVLSSMRESLDIQKQYYRQIGDALNGVIALQFLQTEIVFDMMETSKIYDGSKWKQHRFQSGAISADKLKRAKYNSIEKGLKLDDSNKNQFWQVYLKYEEEADALLGEGYSVIGLYAGEPTDYTPALAKRLGHDLLALRDREVKLKEKYFQEMASAVGPAMAAKFLLWEDYYSNLSKMRAWADSQ